MISIDTSVVVRYLTGTPTEPAGRATGLIESEASIGISLVAIAETAHVLRSFYRVDRADIVSGLLELLTRENITPLEVAKSDAIDALVRAGAFDSVPIQDALIAAAARSAGAVPVYTFDRRFGRIGVAVAEP